MATENIVNGKNIILNLIVLIRLAFEIYLNACMNKMYSPLHFNNFLF